MAILDQYNQNTVSDNLERAWLLNASAMNRATEYRSGREQAWASAMKLERQCTELLGTNRDAEHTYLRFNLLANIALLFQMRGSYADAISIFERVFVAQKQSDFKRDVFLHYRLGVLHLEAGNHRAAKAHLSMPADVHFFPEEWPLADYFHRATGRMALELKDTKEANRQYRSGLQVAVTARAKIAAAAHVDGLIRTGGLARQPIAMSLAQKHAAQIGGYWPNNAVTPPEGSTPDLPPKLPAYVPEIDLEEASAASFNSSLVHDHS